eukprot:2773396-Pyramimonas_sp.AAC.1
MTRSAHEFPDVHKKACRSKQQRCGHISTNRGVKEGRTCSVIVAAPSATYAGTNSAMCSLYRAASRAERSKRAA